MGMKKLRIIIATVVLLVSVLSVANETVVEYNKKVRSEQYDKMMVANNGPIFAVDDWGINYAKRNRNWIFMLCITAFLLTLASRTRSLAFLAYAVTFPLIYQWITMTIQDLSYSSPNYMKGTPYLLKIASPFDWILFAILPAVVIVNLTALLVSFRRR